MAQRSMFFDSVNNDRPYDAAAYAALFSALAKQDGVIHSYRNALEVAASTGLSVQVKTGAAFVQGRMFEVHTAPETLTLAAANATNPRIDRIVLRLNLAQATRSVSLAVKIGTPATSPVAPTLQRDSSVWELSLAQVRVNALATSVTGNITDERAGAATCGYISSLGGAQAHIDIQTNPHIGAVSTTGSTMTGDLKLAGAGFEIDRPATTGAWSKGIVLKNQTGSTLEAGVGFSGTGDATPDTLYFGFGSAPHNSGNGLRMKSDGSVLLNGRNLRSCLVLDDTLASTTYLSYTVVKTFRWYKHGTNGLSGRKLKMSASLWGSGGMNYIKFQVGSLESNEVNNSATSEASNIVACERDISGLADGFYTINVLMKQSGGTSVSNKYLEFDLEY